ncbi:MAG TPA: GDP-mannose 4,6-dehydratase [Acidobacteriota bacterium]|nr:GDP-mannose 4,6-dehydratase [Acidobacteriota bacterium]
MKNYLLTGAAGFIGSRVGEMLLADGHRVTGIDNLNESCDRRLKAWRLARLKEHAGFQFHESDICDQESVGRLFAKGRFDGVLNFAARAGVRQSLKDPHAYFETNERGTLTLLEACRVNEVKKFVLASTSSLYAAISPQPFREDGNTDSPLSPYAASKKAAEALCHVYHHLYGLDVTIFRFFTVYGPAGRPDMSPFRFTQWISEGRPVTIYGDGEQSRDFTFVDDVARGAVLGLRELGFEIINLGADQPSRLIDFLRMIEKAVGKKAQLQFQGQHPADVQATWADISKAARLLGWKPERSIQQGVASLVAWYRENQSWASEVSTD